MRSFTSHCHIVAGQSRSNPKCISKPTPLFVLMDLQAGWYEVLFILVSNSSYVFWFFRGPAGSSRAGFCTRGQSWSGEWVSGVTRVKIPTGGCLGIHPAPVANLLGCWVDGYGCFWFVASCTLLVPKLYCCPSASFAFF